MKFWPPQCCLIFVSTDPDLFCLLCSDSCFCSRFRSCTFMGGRRLPWQIISTKLARSAPSGNQENKICKQWVVLTWGGGPTIFLGPPSSPFPPYPCLILYPCSSSLLSKHQKLLLLLYLLHLPYLCPAFYPRCPCAGPQGGANLTPLPH